MQTEAKEKVSAAPHCRVWMCTREPTRGHDWTALNATGKLNKGRRKQLRRGLHRSYCALCGFDFVADDLALRRNNLQLKQPMPQPIPGKLMSTKYTTQDIQKQEIHGHISTTMRTLSTSTSTFLISTLWSGCLGTAAAGAAARCTFFFSLLIGVSSGSCSGGGAER